MHFTNGNTTPWMQFGVDICTHRTPLPDSPYCVVQMPIQSREGKASNGSHQIATPSWHLVDCPTKPMTTTTYAHMSNVVVVVVMHES